MCLTNAIFNANAIFGNKDSIICYKEVRRDKDKIYSYYRNVLMPKTGIYESDRHKTYNEEFEFEKKIGRVFRGIHVYISKWSCIRGLPNINVVKCKCNREDYVAHGKFAGTMKLNTAVFTKVEIVPMTFWDKFLLFFNIYV